MSRIATLTAVLALATATAAPAATIDLRSPDGVTPVQFITQQDLRSPDAATPIVAGHSAVAQTASDGSLSSWAVIAIIAAAFAAIGLLVVLLRRHLEIERPLGV